MKHKFVVVTLISSIFFMTMACSLTGGYFPPEKTPASMEDIIIVDPTMDPDRLIEYDEETEDQEHEDNPVVPQDSGNANPISVNDGAHEYSVEATSFDCTCQVDGNVTPNFDFQGDRLIAWGDQVYEKTGENTYKREYMGYYILSFPDEPGRENEKVDQLDTTIITFNNNGYVSDSYKGTEMDHCCLFTMTIVK